MRQDVAGRNAIVAERDSPDQVAAVLQQLRGLNFDLRRVSVVAADCHPGVVAHYGVDGKVRSWGERGAFWTDMWEQLSGWAVLDLPALGPLLVAGPLGGWIVAALENEVVFGGMGALGTALYGLGIPKDAVLRHEAALQLGKFLLIAHGAAGEIGKAREVLDGAAPPQE